MLVCMQAREGLLRSGEMKTNQNVKIPEGTNERLFHLGLLLSNCNIHGKYWFRIAKESQPNKKYFKT